jgi:ribonuclease-3
VGPRGALLTDRINSAEIKNFYDFKTRLQETSQARLKATPTYRVVQELGPDHDKRFVVAVTIGTEEWARAVGKSKKEAEQMAAAEAHFRLEGSDAGIRPRRRRSSVTSGPAGARPDQREHVLAARHRRPRAELAQRQ